jgi:phosphohistidine phosphatase
MRRLMLMRHAKAETSTGGQPDLDRALAPRGRSVAPMMGRYMMQHALAPDRAIISSAKRTRETWELVAPAFRQQPGFAYEPRIYEAAWKALLGVVREAPQNAHTLLLIGHNPGMQELAGVLTATGETEARHRLQDKFPTSALAVIDFPTDDWQSLKPSTGRLDRFVTPRLLNLDSD